MTAHPLHFLKEAILQGGVEEIRAAIPEPPHFIREVFLLPQVERDVIITAVLPVLETDEDCWEVIEACVQNTVARPQSNAILAIVPCIPERLLLENRDLVQQIPDKATVSAVLGAIDERIKS